MSQHQTLAGAGSDVRGGRPGGRCRCLGSTPMAELLDITRLAARWKEKPEPHVVGRDVAGAYEIVSFPDVRLLAGVPKETGCEMSYHADTGVLVCIPWKLDTHSTPNWTVSPRETGQSERSDAGLMGCTPRRLLGSSF